MPLIGRERELNALATRLQAAGEGEGGVVLIAGEPGIGKTALSEQLCAYATHHGARVLRGHCYEEGSLSLPYLPFVESLRAYVLERDADALRSELGSAAGYISRLVPEVREKLDVEAPAAGSPEDDRWRLFQGVADFLRAASQAQPVVLHLEDLHWADSGTLALLQHVARNLEGSHLLVLGTYRDVEVDREHPLTAALVEVRRAAPFLRLQLSGLPSDDVRQMLSAAAGRDVPAALAEKVRERTEGNPLYVQEVERYLVDEGILGQVEAVPEEALGKVPPGLRDIVGARLSRLSPGCNRVLTAASVLGREFVVAVVAAVLGEAEEALEPAVEEAVRASIIEEQAARDGVRYRFAHALFQEVLYADIIAPRRQRLHQHAAHALEEHYRPRAEAHAAELAAHFSHSSEQEDREKTLRYAEVAGRHAMSVYDYGEAARLLEKATGAHEALAPEDIAGNSALKLTLARALQYASRFPEAREILLEVADAARERGLLDQMTRAAEMLGAQPVRTGAADEPLERLLVYILEALPAEDSPARAFAMARLAQYRSSPGRADEAEALSAEALEIGHRTGDRRILARVINPRMAVLSRGLAPWSTEHLDSVHRTLLALADELETLAVAEPTSRVNPSRVRLAVALARGDLLEAEQHLSVFENVAKQQRVPFFQVMAAMGRMSLLFALGQVMRALEQARQVESEIRSLQWSTQINPGYRWLLLEAGQSGEALQAPWGLRDEARALVLAETGQLDGARELWQSVRAESLASMGQGWGFFDAYVADLVDVLKDTEGAHIGYQRLLPFAGYCFATQHAWAPACLGPRDRALGVLAKVMGDFDLAERHFLAAVEQCERMGSPTFLALTRYNYAHMLVRRGHRGDLPRARNLLDQVTEVAKAIGYGRVLNLARTLLARLDGPAAGKPAGVRAEAGPDGLTAREVEVLRLVAQGKSSKEIADALVLSVRTVDRHISNIYRKIDVSGRVQAAAYALDHGLA